MLTPEQQLQRKGRLTGSRIAPLMTGDAEAVMRLYREMIGEEEEENLDDNFQVQLGLATEDVNLHWYEKNNGRLLTMRRTFLLHPERDWAGATLDAFDPVLGCPVECKHVGGREPMSIIVDRYQAQMHWQMFVTRTDQCALSVIMGTNDPVVTYVPRDWDYLNTMIERAERFIYHVEMRQPPVVIEPAIEPPTWDSMKTRDMAGNNAFAFCADQWKDNAKAYYAHLDAKDELKGMIAEDERRIHGYGIEVVRDRAKRLHVREIKESKDE